MDKGPYIIISPKGLVLGVETLEHHAMVMFKGLNALEDCDNRETKGYGYSIAQMPIPTMTPDVWILE